MLYSDHEYYNFRLPAPGMPNFNGVGRYVSDIFIIAVISFAQSVSVAALMAQKHGYSIDANQVCTEYLLIVAE